MTFPEYVYKRPDLVRLKKKFADLNLKLETATDETAALADIKKINKLQNDFSSMAVIGQVRHSLNTIDTFYDAENRFYDENAPVVEDFVTDYYKKVIAHKFRPTLEKQIGKQFFTIADLKTKTFQAEIIPMLQEENILASKYQKLKATAEIEFRGGKYNLSTIHPFEIEKDRVTRKEANTAKWKFYADNQKEIETVFDDLVKVRHKIAVALGYKNFVELGYVRMMRSDYDAAMVQKFRAQIEKFIVPVSRALYERQAKRLSLDKLKNYDEDFRFNSGNPKPTGTPEDIINAAEKMYGELSANTDKFFKFMRTHNLMDLVNRDGKATGGYCTFIAKYKAPYIFSNFNGTSGDIDVLTHEAGHAFQMFSSRDMPLLEYTFPTYEACEIHSMSMEFFTWPWMDLFFGADTNKYKFAHLSAALQFLPYGVAVDEFQHIIYENPELTPVQRNNEWKKLEDKYLPQRDYDGNPYLESGCFWQKQNHIFASPFYYIDYTLAQICAFQFWKKDRDNHKKAWSDYVRLCKAGGSLSFLDLVQLAGLKSPFEDGCVESVIEEITKWLASVDDSSF